MKFKVITERGIYFAGEHLKKGRVFRGERKNPHIGTFLHFNQIEETDEEEEDSHDEGGKAAKGKTKPKDEPPLV